MIQLAVFIFWGIYTVGAVDPQRICSALHSLYHRSELKNKSTNILFALQHERAILKRST